MAKQLMQLTLMVNPDATGAAFGNVVAQVQLGTSDDPNISAFRNVVLTLTGQETTAITAFFASQVTKAKTALNIL